MSGDADPLQGARPVVHGHRHVASDPPRHDRSWWFRIGVPLAFFVIGLVVYSAWLGHPGEAFFDERHYVPAARSFADGDWMNPSWQGERPFNWEHPPLGKYWMALSMKALGDEPENWRMPSVLYGAAGLAGLSLLSYRLFRSETAAILAPLFLLLEPMWYLHSRVAMLEVFVAAPMIWAFAFAFGDQEYEPWAASAMAGLALAAKYTALFLLPVLLLVILWRRIGVREVHGTFRWSELGRAAFLAVAFPFAFMFLTWAPFFRVWTRSGGWTYAIDQTFRVFAESFTWGATGPMEHLEASAPLEWFVLRRPTWYWVEWGEGVGAEQLIRVIYAIGNPVLWWGALFLGAVVLVPVLIRVLGATRVSTLEHASVALRLRLEDWRILGSLGVAFVFFVVAYAPFFLLSRISFLFYMTFIVPYLALLAAGALAWILARTLRNSEARRLAEKNGWVAPKRRAPDEEAPAWYWLQDGWVAVTSSPITGYAIIGVFLFIMAFWSFVTHPLYTGILIDRATFEATWHWLPFGERVIEPLGTAPVENAMNQGGS